MKKRKKPHKKILLNGIWLKNYKDVKSYKDSLDNTCCITGEVSDSLVLDHTHINGIGDDGRVRGLLCSEVNMLEGRFLSLFKRSGVEGKYDITFPDFLINMGQYLKEDNSNKPYHYLYMDEMRKRVNRLNIKELKNKLEEEYGISGAMGTKKELVQMYIQLWVDSINEDC